ncbi:MAG: DNA (cytosine-5)-methyltransferase 1 [Candidatus Ordinivivax streblomastigis]|uniref:DNA (cytosine-5-)-methyltransferase n=1 Tax=Candidatus Ordinivivax streblomastigis TaxID=2540710 RepID=A0A5M8P3V1_9BACT|nr:MAG: DNA (cytosine-5)-methyltransferase 1 [Candidatus Ordinivivax streblomastigis]
MKNLSDILEYIENCPDYPLFVCDLFCGAGGTSTGIEKAVINGKKAAKVLVCVNHDENAIASHSANHKNTLHFTEDIKTLELSGIIDIFNKVHKYHPRAKVLLHASLECTNFSKAKGGQPRDADSRTLAEHLFRYIEAIQPDYIQIENVEEFMCWGDLDENGKPISKDKGAKYLQWVEHVKTYGYTFKHRILNAADYGAYTSRKRFFGIFAKHSLPIVFPKPTHSKTGNKDLFDTMKKWKPVKDVLDFADEGESIFTRKKPLSDKTLERIYAGLIKFVAGGKDNFLSAYYGVTKNFNRTYEQTAKSVDDPCGVLTTENRFAKVQAKFLSKHFSGHPESKNISIEGPAHTITAIDHHSLVSTSFIQQRNSGNPISKVVSVERPARTITATGGNQELVQTVFLGRYNGQQNQEINAVSIEKPAPTLTVKDRLSLISPRFIVNEYSGGGQYSSIDGVCPAILTKPKQKIISCQPWIMNTNFNNIGSTINEPSQTITANRKWHYLMNPQYSNIGGSIENPCFTIIARMDKKPPYLISTETGQIAIEVYETDTEPMIRIKQFMALYGIIDIKMRMLKIPELKRIMGFPENYTLLGTQAEQKKYIGNAVEVNMARVLCEALVEQLITHNKKAA